MNIIWKGLMIFSLGLTLLLIVTVQRLSTQAVELTRQNAEQEEEIGEILKQQIQTQKDIIWIINTEKENLISIIAIGEDYPPKKKLEDREWCINRSCLIN